MLTIGSKVHCILYGGKDGIIYNIHGTQRPDTVKHLMGGVMVAGGSAEFDIVWDNGTMSNRTPESLVIGSVQWKVREDMATPEEIMEALENCQTETIRKAAEAKEKADKRAADRESLKIEYPYLIQSPESGGKGAAKNIRIELKRAWPKIKFSVTSDYNSINISWTDGPTDKQVDELVSKYQGGNFNGMEDIYEYSEGAFNDVFGSAQYVFTRRDGSEREFNRAFALLKARYAGNMEHIETASFSEYNNGNYRLVTMNFGGGSRDDLQACIRGTLHRLPESGYEYKAKITKTDSGYNLHYYDMSYGKWHDSEEKSLDDCISRLDWEFWKF